MSTEFRATTAFLYYSPQVYPADDRCRVQQSHSKWHEEGANGLLDLMMVSDDIFSVTSQAKDRAQRADRSFAAFSCSTISGWKDSILALLGF